MGLCWAQHARLPSTRRHRVALRRFPLEVHLRTRKSVGGVGPLLTERTDERMPNEKSETWKVTATTEDTAIVDSAAHRLGLSRAAYVRQAALRQAVTDSRRGYETSVERPNRSNDDEGTQTRGR